MILRARATPLAAALCLALAAPAADAAGYMYFKDSPIVGDLPPSPQLATPAPPGAPSTDVDGRDFLTWQRSTGPAPKARPGHVLKFQAPGKLKLK